jgi:hypothetical protein
VSEIVAHRITGLRTSADTVLGRLLYGRKPKWRPRDAWFSARIFNSGLSLCWPGYGTFIIFPHSHNEITVFCGEHQEQSRAIAEGIAGRYGKVRDLTQADLDREMTEDIL